MMLQFKYIPMTIFAEKNRNFEKNGSYKKKD